MDDTKEQRRSPLESFSNNQAGRLGKRAAMAAGRALMTGFGGSTLIAIGLVLIFTIIIQVFFLGNQAGGTTISTESQNVASSQKFFTYFCQGAAAWQSTPCNIGDSGCAPTSTAMVLSAFGAEITPGVKITPTEVAHKLFNDGGCQGGTSFAFFTDKIKALGFEVGPSLTENNSSYGGYKLNMQLAKSFLDKGYLILADSGPYKCFPTNSCKGTSYIGLHEFVIQDVNVSQNTITIRDPNSCVYGGGDVEKADYNTREVTFSNFGNFLYAYPIKKI